MSRSRIRRTLAAFTLLEVMVAVAILAVALTAIFSSEAGSIKVAHRARNTSVATALARCKMGEIEEQVAEEGLPAIDDAGSDGCCEDAEVEGFRCDWDIRRVVMPEETELGEEGAGEEGGGSEGEGAGPLDQIAAAAGVGEEGAVPGSVDELLATTGGDPAGAMAQLAFSMAFPVLKPSIEEQVRRATVTVKWNEGSKEHSFDVVQYLVSSPLEGEGP